ncbi:MAG: dihydropyrimidinase [Anaerolineaceae bacterium]
MTEYDLVIRNGLLVTPEEIIKTDLAIQEEQIAAWGDDLKGKEVIDANGLLVLPGGVDPHVHLQMPTATAITSDDWKTGSLAAAFGGTTTVIDFVEPLPGQSMQEALEFRKDEADGSSYLDYALHMTIANSSVETLNQIPEMMSEGITSFKIYTTYNGLKLNYKEISQVMNAISVYGGLCMVHAEDDEIIHSATSKLLEEGKISPQWFPFSRPASAEIEAVRKCIDIARESKVLLYVVHLSTSQSIEAISRAKQDQITILAETCPQYLLLDKSQMIEASAIDAAGLVCSPPLRDPVEKYQIWNAIEDGKIQTIGSDHCSFRLRPFKEIGLNDFRLVPGGLPGIELRYPLIHTFGVLNNHLRLQDWVNLCSTQPAKIFGLYPRKGSLAIGSDADIVLFNPVKKMKINQKLLHENVDYSPYNNLELTGYPEMTVVKGKLLVSEGKLVSHNHNGNFLQCGQPNFL